MVETRPQLNAEFGFQLLPDVEGNISLCRLNGRLNVLNARWIEHHDPTDGRLQAKLHGQVPDVNSLSLTPLPEPVGNWLSIWMPTPVRLKIGLETG